MAANPAPIRQSAHKVHQAAQDHTARVRSAGAAVSAGWEQDRPRLTARSRHLLDVFRHRGAPPDLMGVLGLRDKEVRWTRLWAWLLNPDQSHGLGIRFLDGFVQHIGLDPIPTGTRWRVLREPRLPTPGRPRKQTEPDLVLLGPNSVVVVENKVNADQTSPDQYDRLSALVKKGPWRSRVTRRLVLLRTAPAHPADTTQAVFDAHLDASDLLTILERCGPIPTLWARSLVALVCTSLQRPHGSPQAAAARVRALLDAEAPPAHLQAACDQLARHLEPTP